MGDPSSSTPTTRPRLDSVDRLRGLVMVIMALDHVRDFFGELSIVPMDMAYTNYPLYFTRWISHYCAPTFIFLTGVGACLARGRGRSTLELSGFLLTRGLWLVALEIFLLSPLWLWGDFSIQVTMAGVFWAIGSSMILLSALVFLPRWFLIVFGLALVCGHNYFDGVIPADYEEYGWIWKLLHVSSAIPFTFFGPRVFNALYSIVPWVGVMTLGYTFAPVLKMRSLARRTFLVALGSTMMAAFVVIRGYNEYGDLNPWHHHWKPGYTLLSFLNCHKYPPSLDYLLMTLGPSILLLALFEAPLGPVGRILTIFGRVPLFYYLLHLPLIYLSARTTIVVEHALGMCPPLEDVLNSQDFRTGGLHVPLWGVYLLWFATVTILYFPCRWFAGVKQRSKSVWLSYL